MILNLSILNVLAFFLFHSWLKKKKKKKTIAGTAYANADNLLICGGVWHTWELGRWHNSTLNYKSLSDLWQYF
jgi:hypothetical protein